MRNTNFFFEDKLTSIIKHHYKNCDKYYGIQIKTCTEYKEAYHFSKLG